jgi:cellobiose phosphorylase
MYAEGLHVWRGDRHWYPGEAGWMHRLLTESILGMQHRGERMQIASLMFLFPR